MSGSIVGGLVVQMASVGLDPEEHGRDRLVAKEVGSGVDEHFCWCVRWSLSFIDGVDGETGVGVDDKSYVRGRECNGSVDGCQFCVIVVLSAPGAFRNNVVGTWVVDGECGMTVGDRAVSVESEGVGGEWCCEEWCCDPPVRL